MPNLKREIMTEDCFYAILKILGNEDKIRSAKLRHFKDPVTGQWMVEIIQFVYGEP